MSIIRNIAQKIGLDKSVAYSSGARIVQAVAGIGSVLFISTFLTGVEQGFFFTFGSILALQVFFELGLTGIMTQYVAHEASHLEINSDKKYEGESRYISRLASLVRFCFRWYSCLAIIAFVCLVSIGFVYFGLYGDNQSETVEWRIPWLLLCIGTVVKLFQAPFTSILMGLGFVKETSKISFYQQLALPLVMWSCLALGMKLYVIGLAYVTTVIMWQIMVCRMGLMPILVNLFREKITDNVSYMKEIFPYQWRIALSWVSGYFIFQLFNPVLFATEGAVVAGQMGMTLQALNAISALSMSWLSTKVPLYSKLIAQRDYIQLDSIFNKTLKQMVSICMLLLICFFAAVWLLRISQLSIGGNVFADRFLDYLPMLLMMLPVFLQQYTNSWATYLRCHKKEPFLVNSIVGGILCMLSTVGLGYTFGLYGVTIGYCVVTLILFPWGYWIYYSKKSKWHSANKSC